MKKTGKVVYKTTKNTVKVTAKTTKRAVQMAKATAKAIALAIKTAIKLTILAIKAIIAATQALVAAIVAGGWIAVIIIIVVCLIGLLCGSIYGIFFSSEDTNSYITVDGVSQSVTMNQVISNLNNEFINKITQIQKDNPYDEYDITGKRAEWKDILTIYAVRIENGKENTDVVTLNDDKVETLKEIFWDMNEVTFTKDEEEQEKDGETITYTRLHIKITGRTINEMAEKYNFNNEQNKQIEELAKEDYASIWSNVIYGTTGNSDIVKVAQSQIGNTGGETYWSWYGFSSRVEWCACFVSYCANECGYIDAGIIPKFATCESEGVAWFKTCGFWQDNDYIPKERRYYLL